jgi:capsular polysaccharide transport system ATP-binding protein
MPQAHGLTMITLDNVTKIVRRGGRAKILDAVNVTLPADRRIAVLGHDEIAKSTLIRMLAGISLPTKGRVIRRAKLSFPVGYVGGLTAELSVRQNVVHVAKVYRANIKEVVEFVKEVTRFGEEFNKPYQSLTPLMRADLGTALAYAIPFDVYLLDGAIAKGRPALREQYNAIFEERIKSSSVIFSTRDVRAARKYCDMGAVLHRGSLSLYDSVDEALRSFRRIEPEWLPLQEAPEPESDGPEDFFG